MIKWHEHHIIPRHRGGTDDKGNLLRCNNAMHAFMHMMLWYDYGDPYDYVAWKALAGQISQQEANILATKIANTGKSPWNKGKVGVQPSTRKGKPRNEEEKKNIAEGTKKAMIGIKCGRKKGSMPWNKGKKGVQPSTRKGKKLGHHTVEHNMNISEGLNRHYQIKKEG